MSRTHTGRLNRSALNRLFSVLYVMKYNNKCWDRSDAHTDARGRPTREPGSGQCCGPSRARAASQTHRGAVLCARKGQANGGGLGCVVHPRVHALRS